MHTYIFKGRSSGKAHAMRLEAEIRAALLGVRVAIVSPAGTEIVEPTDFEKRRAESPEHRGEGAEA